MSEPQPSPMLTPAEMARAAEDAAHAKATGVPLKSFMLGLTAGGYIALGFVFYLTTQVGAENMPYGIGRLVGGIAFSTGLALVVLTGAELFTSSTLTLTARAAGRISWSQLLTNWGIVYGANFLGALTMVALIYVGGTWHNANDAWGAVVLSTALGKMHHTFLQAFVLGILCNLLVCLAVWAAYAGRTVTDKIVAVTLPIALFIAAGFEHCVANMFLLPLAVLIKDTAGSDFWTATGLDEQEFASLTIPHFLGHNLLPVTLGNIVGGGVMIGIFYWTVFRRHHRLTTPAS
ncbi:formate transporter FocA [Cellulomonas sp. URHE0023]|uniref:formate transporter FocA n=1 Tax=Cellulomonas sp. URHE0023 TaxID=1380354 RepID=UPI000482A453|nr:formate transporter FocA [Cellulomonas sp. URHE0023]